MKNTIPFLAFLAASLPLCAQTPILEYKFDEGTGSSAASTGSNTTIGTIQDSNFVAADFHTPGVGTDNSFAFDNSSSTGMGSLGTGGRVTAGDVNAVDGLVSFTLQGWYNTASFSSIGSNAKLFDKNTGGSSGFSLRTSSSNTLALQVNGTSVASGASSSYALQNEWVFFAVTYDGTAGSLASNNVHFYVGTTSATASEVSAATLTTGISLANANSLILGNNSAATGNVNIRPFDGYLDDMRIFGSTTNSTGSLNLAQLESFRSLDILSPIPEPSTYFLLAIGGIGLTLFLRTRRPSGQTSLFEPNQVSSLM
ncbi:MAG: LamG-like jellyroll fold domain-containing protein [Verrucomicrobiota bacterium]